MTVNDVSERAQRIEQRSVARFACTLAVRIEWGATLLAGTVIDISTGGMFIEMENPLWIGAQFAAELQLAAPVKLECTVRRVEPHRGMAITYSAADEGGRAAVAATVEELSKT